MESSEKSYSNISSNCISAGNIKATADLLRLPQISWYYNTPTLKNTPVEEEKKENAAKPKACGKPVIEKVIFNPPATVVVWSDGTKTVVKAGGYSKKGKKDKFSEEYGLAMAIAKKFCGNRSQFLKLVKNASRPQEEK